MNVIKNTWLPISLAIPALLSLSAYGTWNPGSNFTPLVGWYATADSSGFTGVWGKSPNEYPAGFEYGYTCTKNGIYTDWYDWEMGVNEFHVTVWSHADGYTWGEWWLIQPAGGFADAWVRWQ